MSNLRVFFQALCAGILCIELAAATAWAAMTQEVQSQQGSAAFTGLAQAPEANLFVGAATTSIQIQVPPGRKELTPKLALAYNSSGGPSPYGLGWDLSLGRIQRCGKHGTLSCNDPTYRNEFVLVLPSATVECRLDLAFGTRTSRPCIPAVQEAYTTISYNEDVNLWDVWDKSGQHYVFGSVTTARTGSDTTLLFSASPCAFTYSWGLDHVEDPNGNTLDIRYEERGGILHPEQIVYGGNRNDNQPHVFDVDFVWSDEAGFSRPPGDNITSAIGGFPTTQTRLLAKIDVQYRPDGIYSSAAEKIRSYGFLYDFQTSTAPAAGRQSLLTAVTLYDGNGNALARTDGTPASTTFAYQRNAPDNGRFGFGEPQVATRPAAYASRLRYTDGGSTRETSRDLLDMNGDGFVDLVEIGSCALYLGWDVYWGSPQGFAATPVRWSVPNTSRMCRIRSVETTDYESWTQYDTIDINGDGVPDFVDARTLPYQVYFGVVAPNRMGGHFSAPVPWSAPGLALSYSHSGRTLVLTIGTHRESWAAGSIDVVDLMDMNGDGLLDWVATPWGSFDTLVHCSDPSYYMYSNCEELLAAWSVWLNTGHGFAPNPEYYPAPLPLLSFSTGKGFRAVAMTDLNGDGLPDQVVAPLNDSNVLTVFENTGHAMQFSNGYWHVPEECTGSSFHDEDDDRVVRDLFDINGDSLPDLVTSCGTDWLVHLGMGARFTEQAYTWPAPWGDIRSGDGDGHATWRDVFDMDGDGLVDLVDFENGRHYRNLGGAWVAACDQQLCVPGSVYTQTNPYFGSSKPNLLVQIENGLGGTTNLEYRPSTVWNNSDATGVPRLPFVLWTTTRIEQDDGLCDANGTCRTAGSHTLKSEIQYGFGLYDGLQREFRGFATVQQIDALGNRQETYFHQDGARKGKTRLSDVYERFGAVPIARTATEWVCADSPNGAEIACPNSVEGGDAISVRLKATTRSDGGSELQREEQRSWDPCGNVTQSVKSGLAARSLTTTTSYTCTTAITNSARVLDRPVRAFAVENAGTTTARTLEEKWHRYDALAVGQVAKGNLTSVHTWLDGTVVPGLPVGSACPQAPQRGYGTCVNTTMSYDRFGNVTTVTAANGTTTDTIYDARTNIYPLYVSSGSGSARQQAQTVYDPKCGAVRRQSGPYPAAAGPAGQPFSETIFDSFCRPREVWEPYPGGSSNVKRRSYAYYLTAPGGTSAPFEVATIDLAGGDPRQPATHVWSDSHRYFDALGRPLQSTRRAEVDGADTYVVDGLVEMDERGSVRRRHAPFPTNTAAFVPGRGTNLGSTAFTYDALKRITSTTLPDGAVQRIEYQGALARTTKDACVTSAVCPGSEVYDQYDGFGRIISTAISEQRSGVSSLASRSATTYDAKGRIVETKQGTASGWNEATKIRTRYDSLGRKVELLDPDSGTWMYGYDLVGNSIYQDDPIANQHLQYCHDSLNRVTKKHYMDASSGTYLPFSANACTLAGQIRYTYGETAGPSFGRLIAVDDKSGTTVSDYDVRGRILSTSQTVIVDAQSTIAQFEYIYDAADRPVKVRYPDGELVTHTYNHAGQVKSVVGNKTYLSQAKYDVFGRPLLVQHGNGVGDWRTYSGPQQNFRIATLQSRSASTTHLAYNYAAFTKTGLLSQLTDIGPKGSGNAMDSTHTFSYDGVGRLSGVAGPMLSAAYAYDGLGNITSKEGMAFTYSATKPHTVVKLNGISTGLSHDANGNRTGKAGQSYTYTPDDRVDSIIVGGATVRFVYDHQGARVSKIEPSGRVTRYYGGLAEGAGEYLTKHYFAGDLLLASNRVWAPQLSAVTMAPAVQVAQLSSADGLALLLLFRQDLGLSVLCSVSLLAALLLIAPWRRKAVVGIHIRQGHVLLVLLTFTAASLPIPVAVKPASATTPTRTPTRTATRTSTQAATRTLTLTASRTATRTATRTPTRTATRTVTYSPTRTATRTPSVAWTNTPTRSPTRTPTRTPTLGLLATSTRTSTRTPTRTPTWTATQSRTPTRTASPTRTATAIGGMSGAVHYHLDHLGSVHAITDDSGLVIQYVRYKPYGEIRGHYDRFGNLVSADSCNDDGFCREFTGYDSEPLSGLQYANARIYDPQLGLFLTHDPARQFANPYTYTNWNPVNAADPSGAEITLLAAVIIGAIAGALAGGIQAAISGAPVGEAFKAAAIGAAIGALSAGVAQVVLQPAVQTLTGALAGQLVNAGMQPALATNVATLSVNGSLIAGGIAQAGYSASQGNFAGLIGLASAYALGVGLDALVPDGPAKPPALTEFDVRPGDVLGTNEGVSARVVSILDPTGDTGHTQLVVELDDGNLAVVTSDGQGQRIAGLGDPALSKRGYDVYRPRTAPQLTDPSDSKAGLMGFAKGLKPAGLGQYLGNAGGNVCSSTCNTALRAGGINTGFASQTFVTPNQLVNSGALVRVGRLPMIP